MKRKILLVDDDPNILSSYQRILRKNYLIVATESAREGITAIKEQGPFAVVISDFRMPEMDGVKFLAIVRSLTPDTVRIMLSGQADMEVAVEAINQGNIFRFLSKPCPVDVFLSSINAAVEQYELLMAEKELLDNTLKGSIRVLIDILSIISPLAFKQASRLTQTARKVAARLKVERLWEIELAAMLSQIGCVTIPVEILKKREQDILLTESELEMFMAHPQQGKALLSKIPRLEHIAEAIGDQAINFNENIALMTNTGKGISMLGRILKVVLDLDGLLLTGKKHLDALEVMRSHYERYDPNVFAALEAELMNVQEGFVVKSISLQEIAPGMVIAENIKDTKGVDLIQAGSEISDVLHLRLLNFAKFTGIREPIKVLQTL
ncbi:MAG: two-component system response regulator [Firmicutes bacterium HGW-Firmicutes-15]|nr:MAG: two-component system response regulator [Firmicutes bacterium HGW-Firmicutes-15]